MSRRSNKTYYRKLVIPNESISEKVLNVKVNSQLSISKMNLL